MIYELRQARILKQLQQSRVNIEDIARAWASMDGKLAQFDAEKGISVAEVSDGTYLGYVCETEEILSRAIGYALERKSK